MGLLFRNHLDSVIKETMQNKAANAVFDVGNFEGFFREYSTENTDYPTLVGGAWDMYEAALEHS